MSYYTFNTPYLWPYYQQPVITPLIPAQLSLPASPNGGSGTKHVRFDGDDIHQHAGRSRPPSWHSGMSAAPTNSAPLSSPFVYTTLPPNMPYGVHTPQHRRFSDSALPQAAWGMYPAWMVYPQSPSPSPPAVFNPLLNGEAFGRSILLLDLSSNTFDPRRISDYSSVQGAALSYEELTQTATYPSTTRMVITCDELLPQWKVTLEPCEDRSPNNNGYLGVPSNNRAADAPITVYDVLFAIHRMLQRQVTQREWFETPQDKSTSVARAYTRRCRAVPSVQAFEESQGVRRVDFLQDNHMFKGLVRSRGEQGFEHVRLRVGKR